jgi:hypothetical protein
MDLGVGPHRCRFPSRAVSRESGRCRLSRPGVPAAQHVRGSPTRQPRDHPPLRAGTFDVVATAHATGQAYGAFFTPDGLPLEQVVPFAIDISNCAARVSALPVDYVPPVVTVGASPSGRCPPPPRTRRPELGAPELGPRCRSGRPRGASPPRPSRRLFRLAFRRQGPRRSMRSSRARGPVVTVTP